MPEADPPPAENCHRCGSAAFRNFRGEMVRAISRILDTGFIPLICYTLSMKKHKEKIYQYEVLFDPNGMGYTITVPKLPGIVTEGNSLKDAREMAKDAIRCYLEAILKEKAIAFGATRHERIRVAV